MNFKNFSSLILVFIIFGFLFWNIYINWLVISNYNWKFDLLNLLFLLIVTLPVYTIIAFSWYLLLKTLGHKLNYIKCFKIWIFSNFGRFIPGVVWQYASRVYLSSKEGVPKTISLTAIFLESIFLIISSSVLALITIFFLSSPEYLGQYKEFFVKAFLITISILLLLLSITKKSKYISYLARLQQKIYKNKFSFKKIKIDKKYLTPLIISFFLQFIIEGCILFFLVRFTINLSFSSVFTFIGIYSISWLLGYLTIIAPAGLGVQEMILATLLSFYIPFPIASVIAILFRVSLMISEAISALFIIVISKRKLF